MTKQFFAIALVMAGIVVTAWQSQTIADIKTSVARQAAEYILKKFSKEAVKEGAEALAERLEALVAKHGEEVLEAAKASGPGGVRALEELTGEAGPALKVLRIYGPKGIEVVKRPKLLKFVTQYGDDAAEALVRHPGVAEEVIGAFGKPAAIAIKGLNGQNARRLAMMVDDGSLAKIPQREDLLDIIGKYGDRGMDFIWRHKGVFVGGTVAAAFWIDPKPFIDGTVELAKTVTKDLGKPIAAEAARQFPWTIFYGIVGSIFLATLIWLLRSPLGRFLRRFVPRGPLAPTRENVPNERK